MPYNIGPSVVNGVTEIKPSGRDVAARLLWVWFVVAQLRGLWSYGARSYVHAIKVLRELFHGSIFQLQYRTHNKLGTDELSERGLSIRIFCCVAGMSVEPLRGTSSVEQSPADVPWYRSCRVMLAFITAWGYVFFYLLRIDLSLAIVCMVRDPHVATADNASLADNQSTASVWPATLYLLAKLPSIEDRGQTDRVTMNATDCSPKHNADLEFQSPASYSYDPYARNNRRNRFINRY